MEFDAGSEMDVPVMSQSSKRTGPFDNNCFARFRAMVVLPTPPLRDSMLYILNDIKMNVNYRLSVTPFFMVTLRYDDGLHLDSNVLLYKVQYSTKRFLIA